MMSIIRTSIPVCPRPFPLSGSTGSKQTLNGLFIFKLGLIDLNDLHVYHLIQGVLSALFSPF
jgi:hypothetical protein